MGISKISKACAVSGTILGKTPMIRFSSISLAAILGAVGLLAGCSNIERSRDLSNPNVPAKVLAQQACSLCHGITGNSISPNFPRLAGQQTGYFIKQMNEFKGHNRLDPAGFEYMWGISRHLSEEQIKGLAEYFSAQKPQQNVQASAELTAEGKAIFEGGVPEKNIPPCFACHGPEGKGNGTFPRLAGQHADYLVKQLLVFQRTDERPEGSIMKTIAHDLTSQHIKAVTEFLQGIPPG